MCRESVACVAKEIGSPTSLVNVAGIDGKRYGL